VAPPTASVVVVAAGRAERMGGIDKIAAPIGGRPLLAWTLAGFAAEPPIERIVVVVPTERVAEISGAAWLPPDAVVVAGGTRRQESVAAGIAAVERGLERGTERDPGRETSPESSPDDPVVLVHDGARPAVRPNLIRDVIEATAAHGAAIPVLPVVETLKRLDGDRVGETVDRTALGMAQTPQGVRLSILRAAYRRFPPDGPATFTDEAALLEACTIPVHVVPGQPDNLKVTLPADLGRAASILGADRPRVGYGEDSHPFGPGAPLVLGGVAIPGAPRLHGHSNGDVALHAVASALLGAAGLPDLGRLFPADERTPLGVDSAVLVTDVVERVRDAGLRPARIDLTIVGARPRMASRLDEIRDRVAELAGLGPDDVAVKASTGNLAGAEGAGRGISARAIVTLEPSR
jgi:2-C-methyl-D-erythritol 4-phosphate cytidylyltransferase/2-C-methyl-D-erythritol 2,4-cyclodiphosphate synthase